jgi:Holliday junction resolvase-like predicted endonuclease
MFMSVKTYTLIIGAIPNKNYSAGWLAGSVVAHNIYCEKNGKVFWACPLKYRGISNEDKHSFKELIEKISNNQIKVGDVYKNIKLNKKGYFYDGDENAVLWCFDIEGIFLDETFRTGINNKLKRYKKFVGFREIQLTYSVKERAWFLISSIQQLKSSFNRVKEKSTTYKIPGFKLYTRSKKTVLRTYDFMHGGPVFVFEMPSINKYDLIDIKSTDISDKYLKQFFLTKLPDKNLRERAIQLAFAWNLMEKHGNWTLTMEKKLKIGRPDILFTEEDGTLVVVEIKRADNDDPASQLEKYINELKRKHKKIRGLIICGKKTKELEKIAKEKKFEIIEYSISINFPI